VRADGAAGRAQQWQGVLADEADEVLGEGQLGEVRGAAEISDAMHPDDADPRAGDAALLDAALLDAHVHRRAELPGAMPSA
jgi:hypothetical protein